MDVTWYTPELHAVVMRARDRAIADPELARRASEDANAVLKNDFDFDLPVKVKLVWFNETTFGLLPADAVPTDELSDEMLDLVSAGADQPINYNKGHV